MGEDDVLLNEKMKGKNKMDYKSVQNEVERVRMKLQHLDTVSAQVDDMLTVIGTSKEKEVMGTVATQLDIQAKKLSDLQIAFLSQRNKLETALIKLEAANEELAAANEKVAAANENIADIKKKLADANGNLKAWQIMEMILWGEQPDDIQARK